MISLLLGAPALLAALLMGLIVSIGQAVTQLQDQTLSFVPKVVVMLGVLLYTLPWTLSLLVEYASEIIRGIPQHL